MATINGRQTLNNGVQIIQVDGDPSAGGGTPAAIGSIALVDTDGSFWTKTSGPDTGWELLDPAAENLSATLAAGNTTSGNDISITSGDEITGDVVINGLTYPTADTTNGDVITTDGAGNLTLQTPSGGGGFTETITTITSLTWLPTAGAADHQIGIMTNAGGRVITLPSPKAQRTSIETTITMIDVSIKCLRIDEVFLISFIQTLSS